MRSSLLVIVSVVMPMVASFITYTFISVGNEGIQLDDTQSLILLLAIGKMILLGSSGVFPIQLNEVIDAFMNRERRNENDLYKVPPVHKFPCIRRLFCEAEMAARSSDNYLPQEPKSLNDRNPEEETNPEQEDPFTEMHIEAVKALFREDEKSEDLTPLSRRALGIVEGLTGRSCEEAYQRCPGRFNGPMFLRTAFEELHFRAKDEL